MYIGVHRPADVLAGAGLALLLVGVVKKPTLAGSVKEMKALIAVMLSCSLVFLVYVSFWNFPADMDIHNMESGMKNAYTMIGCITGVAVVYFLEKKYVNFETKAIWWAQVLKVVLGLGLVLAVKEGLRSPLDALFSGHKIGRAHV